MTLKEWLSCHDMSATALARQMTSCQSPLTVARYVRGERMPNRENMVEIFRVTEGAVTPNDFYGVGTPGRGVGFAKTDLTGQAD